jgi:eukaryotic-like serine/threonine-protein kinase
MSSDSLSDATDLEKELAARLAAIDAAAEQAAGFDGCAATAGLPAEAVSELGGAIACLERLLAFYVDSEPPDSLPRHFGKFQIERALGRGGHGVVFLAYDPVLKRDVALKIPRPEFLFDPAWKRRFLREAQAVALLDHPGIVPLLEFGEVGAVCYMASTYCEGPTLAAWLESQRLPLRARAAASLMAQVAAAVGHAHARGVIHRDLKPQNILLKAVAEGESAGELSVRPCLTDFGLAKLTEAGAELTHTGAVLGTPRYMAPEQAQARHQAVGPTADVFALGAIISELVSGSEATHEPATAVLPQDLPRSLRAIIWKCLAAEPGRRYANAALLAADLNRFLAGRRTRAARWTDPLSTRSRRAAAGVAIAALATAGLFSATRVPFAHRDRPRSRGLQVAATAEAPAASRSSALLRIDDYVEDMRLIEQLVPRGKQQSHPPALARVLLDRYRSPSKSDDVRSIEWYYLWRLFNSARLTLRGHQGDVYHVAYSPDGTALASAGKDGARIWESATGTLRVFIRDHADEVNWVSFSPDGRLLATASDDATARLWTTEGGRPAFLPLAHHEKVVAAVFSRDGSTLITGDRAGVVTIWSVQTGNVIARRQIHGSAIQALSLAPDGATLATAAVADLAIVSLPQLGRLHTKKADAHHTFDSVALSHDGRQLATAGGSEHGVRVWDVQWTRADPLLSSSHDPRERVMSVAFSPHGDLLASTGGDSMARLWDIATGDSRGVLAGHIDWVWDAAFSPDGQTLATAGKDGTIKLWVIPHETGVTTLDRGPNGCLAMGYSADGLSLATVDATGHGETWDVRSGRRRSMWRFVPQQPPIAAALTADLSHVAVIDGTGTITIARPLDSSTSMVVARAAGAIPAPTFSADGRRLAFVASDGSAGLLDVTARIPQIRRLDSPGPAPACLAFSPDGRFVAAGIDRRLALWETNTGQSLGNSTARASESIGCLAVSPDGTLCATGGGDAQITFWQTDSPSPRQSVAAPSRPVHGLAFTHDGKTLISATGGGELTLWNVATAKPIFNLPNHVSNRRSLCSLCVAPGDARIATFVNRLGGKPGVGLVWNAARPE